MKSLYGRQFLLTAGMILISFALLGTAFIGLSYQYTIRETRDSMERNADYVADFTAKVRAEGIDVRDMAYQLYVANVAHIANAFVLVTEADGELVLCSDGATIQSGLGGNYLPQSIVSQLQKEGGYSGMTTLGGLFPEKRFVAGTPITVKTVNLATGQTEQTMIGVAYVAAETSDITELWQAFISIFFFTAVVVLCVAFITSSITSLRLTNPLKEIAETARKFGHGEYEVRVQGYEKRKDEVGELAEALQRHGRLHCQERGPPQRVCGQHLPRAQDPHDHHRRLFRRHSGWHHPAGQGARRATDHLLGNPAALPPGAADAGSVPPPVGGECHRPGAVRRVRGHAAGAGEPGEQDQCPPSGRGHPAPRRPRAGVGGSGRHHPGVL